MTKLIAGYLSTPDGNGAVAFAIGINNGTFSWIGPPPAVSSAYSNISRLHFYSADSTGALLAVIACSPGGSFVKLDDSNNFVTVSLTLQNLLSGNAVTLDACLRVNSSGNAIFSDLADLSQPGFWIGTKSSGAYSMDCVVIPYPFWAKPSGTIYAETFAGLTLSNGVAYSQYGVDTKWIDVPRTTAAPGSPFEVVSGTSFNSEHINFHIRPVATDASGKVLPVLTIRRGYSLQKKAAWPILFPLASNPALSNVASDPAIYLEAYASATDPGSHNTDSDIHSAQFPLVEWLNNDPDTAAAQGKVCPTSTTWHVETSGFTSANAMNFWNKCIVDPYLAGLRAVNAALPISFLPTMTPVGNPTGQGAEFDWRVLTTAIESGSNASGMPVLEPLFTRILPGGLLDNEDQQPSGQILVAASLTGVRTHDKSALSFRTTLNYLGAHALFTPEDPQNLYIPAPPNYFDMVFEGSGFTTTPNAAAVLPSVRLGSLDFALGSASPEAMLAFQVIFQPNPMPEGGWLPRISVSCNGGMKGGVPIASYGPGGQDSPPITSGYTLNAAAGAQTEPDRANFAQAAPIVINASPSPSNKANAYTLDFAELTISTGQPQPQQIVLTLRSVNAGGSIPLDVLVLDPEPFLAARVRLNPPAQSTDSDDTLIGNWCNLFPEGPGWRLQAGASGFNLSLPPQAVGEAMVKGFATDDLNAPQPGQPIDFRFSPVMTAQLLASYNAQNAVEPGWNTRRVLGNSSERAPGAALDAANGGAQFELLYGLSASVTEPNLRLSEIFGRLGSLPGPMPSIEQPFTPPSFTQAQSDAYRKSATGWSYLYKQLLSKPAVLELWDGDQGEELVLDTGIDFTIRSNTNSKFPVQPGTSNAGNFDGGLGYALDSANVATELLLQPSSVAGKLVQPRFTALGGYGAQRAQFANGKVIVDTRTSLGRIETLTVTLVGRIGVLWNHALHVTVYERSVEPSQQFENEQDEFPGKPLLRKTSEYVEVLQTMRSYPESATGNPVTRGFVQTSAFKSIRIPVDSAWGGDVGTIGWQVPLWKPDAQPAAVYARPHIGLMVAVDPALGVDELHSEISDPDRLCFYTDTQLATTSDTDSWPPVVGIDFTTQAPYSDSDQVNLLRVDDLDPIVDPGFGQFTYHFVPSQTQVNVVATRTQAAAVGSRLTNASMMRGNLQLPPATGQPPAQFGRVKDWWTGTRAYLEQRVQQAQALKLDAAHMSQWLSDSVAHIQQKYMQQLATDLQGIQLINQYCDTIASRLNSALQRANGQGTTLVTNVLVNFPQDLLNNLLSVPVKNQNSASYTTALKAQVNSAVASVQTTLKPLLGDYGAVLDSAKNYATRLATLNTDLGNLQDLVAKISTGGVKVADLLPYIKPLLPASIVADAGKIRADLDLAAQAVDQATQFLLGSQGTNLVVRIDATWDTAITRLSQLDPTQVTLPPDILAALNSYVGTRANPGTLATSVTSATTACSNLVAALPQSAPSDINNWVKQIGVNVNTAIDTASSGTVDQINKAVTTYFATNLNGAAVVGQVTQAINEQAVSISNQASKLCSLLAQDLDKVKQAILDFANHQFSSILQNAAGDVDLFLATLNAAGQQVESQLRQVAQGVQQTVQQVATAVGEPLRLLRAFGEPPQVPTMTFNGPDLNLPLPSLKYVFSDLLPNVNMTPVLAGVAQDATGLVNAAGNALSQLGLSLPTSALLDRFVPDANLANFDLNSVLPHFAGLDLSSLLSGIKMPDAARNFIRVSHKIDPQTKRASLDADIDFPLADTATVMDVGPVAVQLSGARFTAHVHCDATVGQQITQTSTGQLSGDWVLLIGGVSLVTFAKTALTFDSSGKLSFTVNPANVRLASALQFLADIVNSFDFGDSGFSMHATAQPLLVQCILDLPLPDMSGGAFGIQNLDLGAIFEVGVTDTNVFFLGVGANLGRQAAPFDLTIFILGGAGWMESYLRYSSGSITGQINIGIAASASLAIALGPISGSVSIYFGLFATLQIGNGGGFQLGIMLLVDGRVNLLGIVDLDISLLLEAEYSSGGGLTGRGVLSVSIKICWCFTLEVHTGVQYSFGAASPPPQARMHVLSSVAPTNLNDYDDYYQAADRYVTMLA